MHFDCHPAQAFFARRRACPEIVEGIWAVRAKRRVLCDAIIARLDRLLIKLRHYPKQRKEKTAAG